MNRKKTTRNPLGSIFKERITRMGRKIDVWDVRRRIPKLDANGEIIRNARGKIAYTEKTQRCYTYAAAIDALNEFSNLAKEQEAAFIKNQEHTLFELTEYFRTEYVKPAIFSGKRKIAGYKQDLKVLRSHLKEIEDFFGDVALKKLTYENIRVFAEHLASTPTKKGTLPQPSTYHKKLTVLSRLLNVAIQLDWLNVSPMKRGKNLIQKTAEVERNRMLTYEEEVRLLAACTKEITITRKLRGKDVPCRIQSNRADLKVYILASLDTGMRLGEVSNLRWWQIDFDNNVIYLTEEAAQKTKTGVAGILPMIPRLKDEFLNLRGRTTQKGKKDFVLPRMDVDRAFKKTCQSVGIENLQFRDLRATGATRMLLAGNAAALVMKITRHTRTDTFVNHYTAVDTKNAQIVGEKLQEFNEFQLTKIKNRNDVTDVSKDQKYAA